VRLTVDGVGYRIGEHQLLEDVCLDVPAGSVVGLVGPNGSGKSTLLRLLYRALRPQVGAVWLDGGQLWKLPARQAAQQVGAVPQEQPTEFEMTVLDTVRLGRLPHQRLLSGERADDRRIVTEAIERVGLTERQGRTLSQLSGGERQRAVIARALAQQPSVLLLDEPTNHLDVRYQHELLTLLGRLGLTTLVALHDLNLAAQYCQQVVVLGAGRVVAAGPVGTVLVPDTISHVFGVGAVVVRHPVTGAPQLLFHPCNEELRP